jgi:hypothetical protein
MTRDARRRCDRAHSVTRSDRVPFPARPIVPPAARGA